MPLIPDSAPPVRDAGLGLDDPRTPAPREGGPGLAEQVGLSFRTGSLVGSLFDTIPSLVDRAVLGEKEPGFDPWGPEYVNDQFFIDHPYMIPAYDKGVVDDVPNRFAYANLMDRMKLDYERRQRLSQAGLATQLVGGIIGSAPDFILGGILARGLGVTGYLKSVAGGGYVLGAARAAGVGAAGNVAYDAALRAASEPYRTNTEPDLLSTALAGAGFGAVAHGISLASGFVSAARAEGIRRGVAETVASPVFRDAIETGRAEAEGLDAILREFRTGGPGRSAEFGKDVSVPPSEGLVPTAPISMPKRMFSALVTPETEPIIARAKAEMGDRIEFVEHPMQQMYDLSRSLEGAAPASMGPVGDAIAKVYSSILPSTATLTHAKSPLAQHAARLFWDMNRPTEGQVASPLEAGASPLNAESRTWAHEKWLKDFEQGAEDAYRLWRQSGPEGPANRQAFSRLVYRRMVQEDEVRRGARVAVFDANPGIAKAVETYKVFNGRWGNELHDAGMLSEVPSDDGLHLVRRRNTEAIRFNRDEYANRLRDQFDLNRVKDFETGAPIDPMSRPIIDDAVNHGRKGLAKGDVGLSQEQRASIKAIAEKNGGTVADLTEQDLADAGLLKPYLEEVRVWQDARIESHIRDILMPENGHGVERGMSNPSPLKNRVMELNESNFEGFLDDDAFGLARAYHAKVSGKAAVRGAIASQKESWGVIVKELTGKDLEESGYDPGLIKQAVSADFDAWIKASADRGDIAFADKLNVARQRWEAVFDAKMMAYEGRHSDAGAGVLGGMWRFTAKQLLRMPYMAYLGKVGLANIGDFASVALAPSARGRPGLELIRMLIRSGKLATRDLETLHAASGDGGHTLMNVELGDIGAAAAGLSPQRFGPGRTGRALAAIDAGMSKATNAFTSMTGISRLTALQKRMAAHFVMQDTIRTARKLADAAELRAGGLAEHEALAKVGLSAEEAADLARRGIDARRATRLMGHLDKHALDWRGESVTSAHDGYIHPNLHAWADADQDLFRRFVAAVDSKVMDLIVTPKQLSRPLSAASGGSFSPLIQIATQFMSFPTAWGRQLLPLVLANPSKWSSALYVTMTAGLSAVADATYAALSGKRTIRESIDGWTRNPVGMMYAALMRSPLLGWLQRPLGLAEYRMSPIKPTRLFGSPELTTMYGRRDTTVGDLVGPAGSWLDSAFKAAGNAIEQGRYRPSENRPLWNAMPFHNLWFVDLANRISETMYGQPIIGPPAIRR